MQNLVRFTRRSQGFSLPVGPQCITRSSFGYGLLRSQPTGLTKPRPLLNWNFTALRLSQVVRTVPIILLTAQLSQQSLTSHLTHNGSFRRRVFPANHLAMVLTKQTYNNQDTHKKPRDICKKPRKLNQTNPLTNDGVTDGTRIYTRRREKYI